MPEALSDKTLTIYPRLQQTLGRDWDKNPRVLRQLAIANCPTPNNNNNSWHFTSPHREICVDIKL